ncbi:DUF3592 domain-containing protein [Nocardiopsis sp. HNM0947]|uniref:DUF3592 domain-containing protein n=1 Tax=Nocardiopsis coralli TaxID=2772213 RepID=A0ABR9P7I3_9ACTN|nr:DUF3592 domain-containing protein [Nocardiopsis coralli]MBE2999801.1 DUF3592 domain-containing protein [Nocardiopsis coralli]
MDNELLEMLALPTLAAAAVSVYAVRDLLRVRSRQEDADELRSRGVPVRGVVTRVHPLNRSPHGHPVTVRLHGADGARWEADDTSGLGGHLVREGTPVEAVHHPDDPGNVAVLRAARPGDGAFYPVNPHGRRPGGASYTHGLALLGGAAVFLLLFVLVGTGSAGFLPLLLPPFFAGLGVVLIVRAVQALRRAGQVPEHHTAGAEATVTDAWSRLSGGRNQIPTRVHQRVVRFVLPDGREIHRRDGSPGTRSPSRVGDRIPVRHAPDDPGDFTLLTPGPPRDRAWWAPKHILLGSGILLVSALAGLILLPALWF